MLLMESDNLL